jgi:hypothetical protein
MRSQVPGSARKLRSKPSCVPVDEGVIIVLSTMSADSPGNGVFMGINIGQDKGWAGAELTSDRDR